VLVEEIKEVDYPNNESHPMVHVDINVTNNYIDGDVLLMVLIMMLPWKILSLILISTSQI
jgi:hypothetical protein